MEFLSFVAVNVGPEKRGHLVDWVEKASFACLSKLFEIDAKERHYKTLLTARNLMVIVRESQEYVVNTPQENAKGGSAWGALYCEGSSDLPGVKRG